eukprot:GHVU01088983.1.p1 GENE.GHVU01088983.1~~GHVU01088983.1.p1  ORF type:complete len:126 (-),score=8.40 GHVU01088983.1:339-716(-)
MERTGVFSWLLLSWATPYLRRGLLGKISADEIPPLSKEDACQYWSSRFEEALAREEARVGSLKQPSIIRVIISVFRWSIVIVLILKTLNEILVLLHAWLLSKWIMQSEEDPKDGETAGEESIIGK